MASGVVLGIRLRFHNHAPQKVARGLTFQQQATDEVGGDQLGRAGEEGLGKGWGVLDRRVGYGNGLVDGLEAIGTGTGSCGIGIQGSETKWDIPVR